MTDFTTSKRLFHVLCAPLLTFLAGAAQTHNTDFRVRKFTSAQHMLLTIFAHLTSAPSANAVLEELNDLECEGRERNLQQMLDFDYTKFGEPVTLNQSSFSRANSRRSWRLWRYCFHRLLTQAKNHCPPRQLEGLGRVVAVDGSLFDCLPRMIWAAYRTSSNKVKGHFFFDPFGLPQRLVLTSGKGSEREVLSTYFQAGVTYLIDRGYIDYGLFTFLQKQKVHFVTRLLSNAVVTVLETFPLAQEQREWGMVADQLVRLGAGDNTVELRLVSWQDTRPTKSKNKDQEPREWHYITSRLDLTSRPIVELYHYPWEIECFLSWFKRHMQYGHWYSECENGVLIQLYAGLITFLLLKLYVVFGAEAHFKGQRIDLLRWVARHLFDPLGEAEVAAYLSALSVSTNQGKT